MIHLILLMTASAFLLLVALVPVQSALTGLESNGHGNAVLINFAIASSLLIAVALLWTGNLFAALVFAIVPVASFLIAQKSGYATLNRKG